MMAALPLIPPENPLQLANMNNGSCSLSKSLMVWAVLKAESGYHTCPAWLITCTGGHVETGVGMEGWWSKEELWGGKNGGEDRKE